MEFCCYRCCRGQSKFLFYLLAYHYVNMRAWKNIKRKVSKPSVSKSQALFNKVFWNINPLSCFTFGKNFHRQCTSHITFLEKNESTGQYTSTCISSKLQACFSFYWYWLQIRCCWTTDAHIRRQNLFNPCHSSHHFTNRFKHDIKKR